MLHQFCSHGFVAGFAGSSGVSKHALSRTHACVRTGRLKKTPQPRRMSDTRRHPPLLHLAVAVLLAVQKQIGVAVTNTAALTKSLQIRLPVLSTKNQPQSHRNAPPAWARCGAKPSKPSARAKPVGALAGTLRRKSRTSIYWPSPSAACTVTLPPQGIRPPRIKQSKNARIGGERARCVTKRR